MEELLNYISVDTAKAFKYFEEYYDNFDNKGIALKDLPFEMGLGVFVSFFTSINSDIELYSYEKDALIDAVKEAFDTYEEYLFLDS